MAPARPSSAISEIWYYTDYSDRAAPAIRLGTIAEAATDKILVLVMLGRARLTERELGRASGFNRQQLENVWTTLSGIMQEAWSKRPKPEEPAEFGSMLKFLADKYSMSLHFQSPHELSLPQAVAAKAMREPKTLGDAIARILESDLRPRMLAKRAKPARGIATRGRPSRPVRRTRSFRESLVTDAVARL